MSESQSEGSVLSSHTGQSSTAVRKGSHAGNWTGLSLTFSGSFDGHGGEVLTSLKGKHAAAPSKLREDEVEESNWVNVSSLLQLDRMGLDEEVSRVWYGNDRLTEDGQTKGKERLREFRMGELQMPRVEQP
ncbi:hypothetical protein NL676_008672 [Syzygium grande]|nr:hypothetical protein NL676_008672 [Syzygium grande]